MAYSRRDVWAPPAGDTTLADYASAVALMQGRADSDPTSWSFQAAMHGNQAKPTTWPWNQCKHFSWWFLPWHRMYIWYFEQIVRAAVVQQGGSADWALPYWNYGLGGQQATLPLAFRDPQVNDAPNALYVADRAVGMNDGTGSIPTQIGDPIQAMQCDSFVGSYDLPPAEFGGSPADPSLQFAGPMGVVENTPHNQVHNLVGGLMSDPDTAAQDPIFWLHHANIDRIWNQWAAGSVPHQNPSDQNWLSQTFKFYDAQGNEASLTCADVLDIASQLDYEYVGPPLVESPIGPPKLAAASVGSSGGGRGRRPAELVGASDTSVRLTGVPVTTSFVINARAAHDALSAAGVQEPSRVYLTVQEIEGDSDPGTVYGIYVNLPDDAAPEVAAAHYAGAVSFFGIRRARAPRGDEPPHSVTVSHDITQLTKDLQAQGEWDGEHVTITFRPMGLVPPDRPELSHALPEGLSSTDPPIKLGRVSIFYS
jgi:tyrosinase